MLLRGKGPEKGTGVVSVDGEWLGESTEGMLRRARSIQGGLIYHALNRANGRLPLFRKEADYGAFECVVEEAYEREPLRILAYCAMPNHWHWVVWPETDGQVSEFFRWLTVTHTQRWHAHDHTSGTGHLYQGRFKSFPVETDEHLYAVLRYVERNPVRAELVPRARVATPGPTCRVRPRTRHGRNWTRWRVDFQALVSVHLLRQHDLGLVGGDRPT